MEHIGELKIELFFPNKKYVQYMNEVTNVNLFTNMGREIDEDGLYSQRIFGVVGSEMRMNAWAYIDLNIPILHPRIYFYITKLGMLYDKILSGKAFAIFDKKKKDFVLSDIKDGETGYYFFMKHLHEVKFRETGSKERQDMIDTIYKYLGRGTLLNDKLMVLPAGLRDFQIDSKGKLVEDEVNDIYRAVFNSAVLLKNISNIEYADAFRYNLQKKVNELYLHFLNVEQGKRGFIQGSWASRAVEFRSRTVITGTPIRIDDLSKVDIDIIDTCDVGLKQYVKAIDPITKHSITKYFISNAFREGISTALLLTKDFKKREVPISIKMQETWVTNDGLDKVMNTLMDASVNNEPVRIGDYYLAVIVDKGREIDYYPDVSMIPEDDKKYMRPLTYGEMFYVSIYDKVKQLPGFMVRYPVTEQGSVVPVKVGVHTTTNTRPVTFTFKGIGKQLEIPKYPSQEDEWINGMNIPHFRLSGLGADRDGDQMSLTVALMEESIDETNKLFDSWEIYLKPDGTSAMDFGDKILKNVMQFMTRRR